MQLNLKNCFFPSSEIEIIPFNKLLCSFEIQSLCSEKHRMSKWYRSSMGRCLSGFCMSRSKLIFMNCRQNSDFKLWAWRGKTLDPGSRTVEYVGEVQFWEKIFISSCILLLYVLYLSTVLRMIQSAFNSGCMYCYHAWNHFKFFFT